MENDQFSAPDPIDRPKRENRFLSWLKNLFVFLILIIVIMASFWISFQLGKRILMPVKKLSGERIQAPIPEPPPSIAALQKLGVDVSEESIPVAVPEPEKIAEKPRPVVKKVARPARRPALTGPARHYYKVQAGVFENKADAQELAGKVKAAGVEVFVRKVSAGWRVQVGAYKTKPLAEEQRKIIQGKGFTTQVIYE